MRVTAQRTMRIGAGMADLADLYLDRLMESFLRPGSGRDG